MNAAGPGGRPRPPAPSSLPAPVNRRPKLTLVAPGASPEEAAAVVAAIERFMRETAPATAPPPAPANPWLRAARLEATRRDVTGPTPWGDGLLWGRSG